MKEYFMPEKQSPRFEYKVRSQSSIIQSISIVDQEITFGLRSRVEIESFVYAHQDKYSAVPVPKEKKMVLTVEALLTNRVFNNLLIQLNQSNLFDVRSQQIAAYYPQVVNADLRMDLSTPMFPREEESALRAAFNKYQSEKRNAANIFHTYEQMLQFFIQEIYKSGIPQTPNFRDDPGFTTLNKCHATLKAMAAPGLIGAGKRKFWLPRLLAELKQLQEWSVLAQKIPMVLDPAHKRFVPEFKSSLEMMIKDFSVLNAVSHSPNGNLARVLVAAAALIAPGPTYNFRRILFSDLFFLGALLESFFGSKRNNTKFNAYIQVQDNPVLTREQKDSYEKGLAPSRGYCPNWQDYTDPDVRKDPAPFYAAQVAKQLHDQELTTRVLGYS
jgi:hypothetical protein